MQSAINIGIFNPGTFAIPFNCPTGNCTFLGQYHSVGYCSECTDISADVKVTGNQANQTLNFTLPSGLWAANQFVLSVGPVGPYFQVLAGMSNHTWNGFQGDCPASQDWSCRGYGAAQCSLFPCVRSLTGTVKGGNLTEIYESSSAFWGDDGIGEMSSLDMTCLEETGNQSLRELGYQFHNDTQWLAYNVSLDYYYSTASYDPITLSQYNATKDLIPAKCVYSISADAFSSLALFLQSFFSGQIEAGPEALAGPCMLQAMWVEGNVSFASVQTTFSNVADSMTANIRQNGAYDFSGYKIGDVNRDETCVHPHRGWMAFPAKLSALTIAFFVAMVGETRSNDAGSPPDYKSSLLPLMYHGLEQGTQDSRVKEINRTAEMEKDTKRLYVRLIPTHRGWKFVEVAVKPSSQADDEKG